MSTEPFDYTAMSPDATRKAAAMVAEGARFLNHATRFPAVAVALEAPQDVDAVLADVETLMERLPQLLAQLGAGLVAEVQAGRVEVVSGRFAGRPAVAVAAVRELLAEASGHMAGGQQVLHDARQVTAALAARDGGGVDQ